MLKALWVEAALKDQTRVDEPLGEVSADIRHLLHPFERAALDLPNLAGWERCPQVLTEEEAAQWLRTSGA